MMEISTLGALLGLAIAIVLISVKIHPVYAIILGALLGGLLGGGNLDSVIQVMFSGAQSMAASGLRILTSGVLVGALVITKATDKISVAIITAFGEKRALIAISLASMLICAIGVFIPVAVITVAPIAIDIKRRINIPDRAILIALIGGGKAGNIISLNPNTIAVADNLGIDVARLIVKNGIPAVIALIVTVIIANIFAKKEIRGMSKINDVLIEGHEEEKNSESRMPGFLQAITGPVIVVVLLMLKLVTNINIDTFVVLPAAGLATLIVTGNIKKLGASLKYGISKVSDTFLLLIATGTIAGIINASSLTSDISNLLSRADIPVYLLAPLSGMLLAAATASTTAGATIASQSFADIFAATGVSSLSAGAMINASATIIDSMPHGSFFHASADAVGMNIKDRLKLLPVESLIGLSATITGIVMYNIC